MSKFLNLFFGKRRYSVKENRLPFKYLLEKKQELEFIQAYEFCKSYTMTSKERMYALYKSVLYILENDVPEDFIECGVWRGGSSMLIATVLKNRQITNRRIHMFDTYEGMSAPSIADFDFHGKHADELLNISSKEDSTSIWCYADFEDVENNMQKTGIPIHQVNMVKGMVEHTIPSQLISDQIALQRLDTDFYESTRHELI
jgi:O-methyltransferase